MKPPLKWWAHVIVVAVGAWVAIVAFCLFVWSIAKAVYWIIS